MSDEANDDSSTSHTARYRLIGVILGLAASLFWIGLLFPDKETKFENLALNHDSVSLFSVFEGHKVHCTDLTDLYECIEGLSTERHRAVALWFGNSQLHVINHYHKGDSTAAGLLHERLSAEGWYLLTASQPNANLQEHLAMFAYLLPIVRPKVLLLPVVMDDLRENGLRDSLVKMLDDRAVMQALSQSAIGIKLLRNREETLKRGSDGGDLGGLRDTLQERSETWLTNWLDRHWSIWRLRPEGRGQTMNALYQLRNWIFGIDPTTARRMIPGRYEDNLAALKAIVQLASGHGVTTYIYIAPLRNDLPRPYDPKEYATFRTGLFRDFANFPNVVVTDLENVVPNRYWGDVGVSATTGQVLVDFMHFESEGHRYFANAIYDMLHRSVRAP